MKFRKQKLRYSCGAVCLSNLLLLMYGKRISEKRMCKIVHTTREGTDEYDIEQTLENYELQHNELNEYNKNKGAICFNKLYKELYSGAKAILCVDNFEHWVLATGIYGEEITITDSADDYKNSERYNKKRLIKRWWNGKWKYGRPQYFCIIVKNN